MKRILIYLSAIGLLALSCSREVTPSADPVEEDFIPVNLGLSLPVAPDTKASIVTGTNESNVSSIYLLCFNEAGAYLDKVAATLTPANGLSGTLRARVPKNTASIHFIGNRDLSGFTPASTGEGNIIQELVSGTSTNVNFWGYYKNTDATAFKNYVNNPEHIIYLLRDRARIEITAISDSDIASVEWIATNGLNSGYVVPFATDLSTSNSYWREVVDGESVHHFYGNSVITPKEDASRYNAAAGDLVPSATPLYLFEDRNSIHQQDAFIRLILKATYKDSAVRFHPILLIDDDYLPLPVLRSHSYRITITKLPKDIGYTSFDAALDGDIYSNHQTVSIDHSVTSVSDGTYSLELPEGTSFLYQTGGAIQIPFTYLMGSTAETGRTVDDFVALWLECEDGLTSTTDLSGAVSYNAGTGAGNISLTISSPSSTLRHGLILLQDTKHGLSRFIEIYSITNFVLTDVSLVKESALRNVDRDGDSVPDESVGVYKLQFTLPENYPASMYPIQLSMATNTLSPFSNDGPSTAAGKFGVDVRSTGGLASSDTDSDWNYKASTWDYWYTYSIPAPAGSDRTITLYLDDISSRRGGTTTPSKGLYLSLPNFGAPTGVYAALVPATAVSVDNLSVAQGNTATLVPHFTPANADGRVAWSSSNTSVATVNSATGEVAGVTPGNATITATVVGSSISTTCTVTVYALTASIDQAGTQTVYLHRSKTLTATTSVGAGASIQSVEWSSSNPDVVTVSNGVITGVSKGSARITVIVTDNNGYTASDSRDVTVNNVVTFTTTSSHYSNQASAQTAWEIETIRLVFTANFRANPNANYVELARNKGFTVTHISSLPAVKIKNISITYQDNNHSPGSYSITSGGGSYSYSNPVGTWTNDSGSESVTLSFERNSGTRYVQIKSITVTYE